MPASWPGGRPRGCAAMSSPTRFSMPCGTWVWTAAGSSCSPSCVAQGRPGSGSHSPSMATRWAWVDRPRSTPPHSRLGRPWSPETPVSAWWPTRWTASTWWRRAEAAPRQVPDIGEADRALRLAFTTTATALADLDVARWRPEVADELMELGRQRVDQRVVQRVGQRADRSCRNPLRGSHRCARRWPCRARGQRASSSSRSRTTAARCRRTRSAPAERLCDRSSRPPAERWWLPVHRRRGLPTSHSPSGRRRASCRPGR